MLPCFAKRFLTQSLSVWKNAKDDSKKLFLILQKADEQIFLMGSRRILKTIRLDVTAFVFMKSWNNNFGNLEHFSRRISCYSLYYNPFEFRWYVTEWTPCSKTCGRGLQSRKVICQQKVSSKETVVVPDSTCPADTKPFLSSESEYCNVILCPANWAVNSEWSKVRYRPVMPWGTAILFYTKTEILGLSKLI